MSERTGTGPAFMCELSTRRIVGVSGDDAKKFLGDLVTGDIAGLEDGGACYAGLLSPQGKVLFDFLLFQRDGGFLIELPQDAAAGLVKRLSFYRLRAKIEIGDLARVWRVMAFWDGVPPALPGVVADPRNPELGYRAPVSVDAAVDETSFRRSEEARYHARRIRIGVPEAVMDFAYGEVFPHDIAMDQLGGVDFDKGCYVGQEVVSRMEHRGSARRRIVLVEGDRELPSAGVALEADGRAIGTLGSSDGTAGLAIARLDRARDARDRGSPVTTGDAQVSLSLPEWARYTWASDA